MRAFLPTLLGSLLFIQASHAELRISEISATGDPTFLDFEDEASDWIEIENTGGQSVPLLGWSLSDSPNNPRKWGFPDGVLHPGERMVVFASGKEGQFGEPVEHHTNFGLSRTGESVVLTPPAGSGLPASRVAFPEQRRGYTYGVHPNRSGTFYLDVPSPGAPNQTSEVLEGIVPDLAFMTEGGFHDGPVTIAIQPSDPLSKIYYTTDSSNPSPMKGILYEGPFEATRTQIIRAAAFRTGRIPSNIETRTYWIDAPAWMAGLPVMALTMDPEDWNGETGIRGVDGEGGQNAVKNGREWERPLSVEYYEKGSPDRRFLLNAGIRMHGNNSTRVGVKPSFRLYFRDEYGPDQLMFPLIPESTFTDFNGLVLRGGHQDPSNPFIQDELARRLFSDMGQVSSLGAFVHLFVNGSHLGYYNPVERFDGEYFQSRYGVESDWDIIRNGALGEGSDAAFQELYELIRTQPVEDPNVYREVTKRLDVVNFIDYLLLNLYGSTWDWPGNNVTISHEAVPGGKIRYHVWDAEGTFGLRSVVTADTLEIELLDETTNESRLFVALRRNESFRQLFAARMRKHFFEDGALTDSHVLQRFLRLREQVLPAIPNFVPTVSFAWAPLRRHYLLAHLQSHGMLQEVDLPVLEDPPTSLSPPRIREAETRSADLDEDGRVDARDLSSLLSGLREDRGGRGFGEHLGRIEDWEVWSLPVGRGVRDLAFTDTDGDGLNDLIAVNANFGKLLILRNLGGGRFAAPRYMDVGLGASAVAVGDFNGDALPDVVTANDGLMRQSLTVLLNRGNGEFQTFDPTEILSIEETPYPHVRQIRTADFDGDSHLDLLVGFHSAYVNQPNVACLLFGDGEGGFQDRTISPMGITRLLGSSMAAVGDFHGTGDPGAVVLDGDRSAFLWKKSAGRVLEDPVPIPPPGNFEQAALDSADFDQDGLPDLVFGDGPIGSVRILFNTGAGGFSTAESIRIPTQRPQHLQAGDLNGDGSMDVLVANTNPTLNPPSNIQVLWNRGDRVFEPSPPLPLGGEVSYPGHLAIGDIDGSGIADFAASDEYLGRITLFLQASDSTGNRPDLDDDGRVDFQDLGVFSQNWKTTSGPSQSARPRGKF